MPAPVSPIPSEAEGYDQDAALLVFVRKSGWTTARRIAIEVDANNTGCKATVINGKQAGSNVVRQGGARGSFDASSVQIGAVSCSIREGNVFGQ